MAQKIVEEVERFPKDFVLNTQIISGGWSMLCFNHFIRQASSAGHSPGKTAPLVSFVCRGCFKQSKNLGSYSTHMCKVPMKEVPIESYCHGWEKT